MFEIRKIKPARKSQKVNVMDKSKDIRIQLQKHRFTHFFDYYWISLIFCLVLTHIALPIRLPWTKSSEYVEYASNYATMTGFWITALSLSVNKSTKFTDLLTDMFDRKICSFIAALTLAISASILVSVNITWFLGNTTTSEGIIQRITLGAAGIGFSTASIASPYIFVILTQGRLDIGMLDKRVKYLKETTTYLKHRSKGVSQSKKQLPLESRDILLSYLLSTTLIALAIGGLILKAYLQLKQIKPTLVPYTYANISLYSIIASLTLHISTIILVYVWKDYHIFAVANNRTTGGIKAFLSTLSYILQILAFLIIPVILELYLSITYASNEVMSQLGLEDKYYSIVSVILAISTLSLYSSTLNIFSTLAALPKKPQHSPILPWETLRWWTIKLNQATEATLEANKLELNKLENLITTSNAEGHQSH